MPKNYLIFSKGWDAKGLAKQLKEEGHEVIVGSDSEIEGVRTVPHEKLLDIAKKLERKDKYSVYGDTETSKDLIKSGFNDILVPKEERDDYLAKMRGDIESSLEEKYSKKYQEDVSRIKEALRKTLYEPE